MAKKRKGFNWKARDQTTTVIDKSQDLKVSVEIEGLKHDVGYDDSNVLALPSTKRETKKETVQVSKKKKLSKKERRKLEGIIKRREKKANRESILASLASHQVGAELLSQMVGIAEVQTGRPKRKLDTKSESNTNINTIAGSNKKRRQDTEPESSDGEESVHTSDMSSDEEDLGEATNTDSNTCTEICLDQNGRRSDEGLGESEGSDSGNDTKGDMPSDATSLKGSSVIHSSKVDNTINHSKITTTTTTKSGQKAVSNASLQYRPAKKARVRSTSGKWKVEELVTQSVMTVDSSIESVKNINCEEVNKKDKSSNSSCALATESHVISADNSAAGQTLPESSLKDNKVRKKTVHIPVARDPAIQEGRLKLPILSEEQQVMEAITDHPVVIICGETGSGKTTQVPQFLYEAGYAHGGQIIGVTEPRRVAAMSMSTRVAKEMSLTHREVSYQIRYEGNTTPDTRIKFMTDGVLLKEVQKDFLLTKYSAIIIDEAHERSMYTDILIGLLSRIVPLRNKKDSPLKLVIMSATLRVEDFTDNRRLFKVPPPVIKIDSRQYPVTIHYNKRTPIENYLNEVYRKTCKIHSQLPEGGILIFVTGQQEVHTLCRKLKQTFPMDGGASEKADSANNLSRKQKKQKEKMPPKISLDKYSVAPVDDEEEREGGGSDLEFDFNDNDDLGNHGDDPEEAEFSVNKAGMMAAGAGCTQPLYVLPLYSLMSSHKQAKVFEPVPEGCRLCVVATNVAETSLTIPNIKYVVDSGKVKTKFYDKVTGVSTFRVTWTSKAGANQRAGRAGRLGPGHCYRLYSSAVFNDEFEKFSPAEITRRPVDDLVLQMKDMSIDKVANFPYPTPPDLEQIQAAEKLLLSLGALSAPFVPRRFKETKKAVTTTITPLGRAMACFPVSPRYGKMLALGHQQGLLPYVVIIVAALSVQEMFQEVYGQTHTDTEKDEVKQKLTKMLEIKHRWAGAGHSLLLGDLMVMLKAVGSCEYEGFTEKFCDDHGLRVKAMREIRKLRMQLTNTVNSVIPDANLCVDPKMAPPQETQAKLLRQIVLAGMADHVARKLPDLPPLDPNAKRLKYAYQCPDLDEPVFIHPTSVLYKRRPDFIVYQHMEETSKLYMKGIVAIEPEWLSQFAQSYVTFSKPLADPPPSYDEVRDQVMCHMTGTFGNGSWPIPAVSLEYPTGVDKIKWFAKALLEGKVITLLKKFTPDLLSSPSTMVKTWAKLQPRTESLMKALMSERVDNRQTLIKACQINPSYLLTELQEWLPQSRHSELAMVWPPR